MLNRPDVIQGVHESMVEAGARGRGDRHVPGLAPQARRVGPRRPHATRSTARPPRSRARRSASTASSPARSARPATCPRPRTRRSADPLPRARRGLRRAGPGPARGRRRPADHRDRAGHPRGQGRHLRHARGVQATPAARVPIQASVSLLPNGGKMLLGTDISRRARHARGAQGRRDRPQLLDRPRGHARRDPLPRRVLARCRSTASRTPASRTRARTARRSSPSSPARSPTRSASSSSATASPSSAAAAARRPSTSRAISRARRRPHAVARARRPRPPHVSLDDRRRRRSCRSPRPTLVGERVNSQGSRKAKELLLADDYDGLAAGRRGPGRGRRARARPLRRAHRAPGRGRADAPRGQEGLAHASPRRSRSTRPSPR